MIPRGLDEIIAVYGDPRDEDGEMSLSWYAQHIDSYTFPADMAIWGGKRVREFRAHRLVGPLIVEAETRIISRMGIEDYRRWDAFGGCFYYRQQRGYQALSTHAWGIAIDRNPDKAILGGLPTDQHAVIADVYRELGFVWGGDWRAPWRCDPCHFQLARGY